VNAQRIIAVVMILGSSLLVAWTSGDIAFPAVLSMLGMVGLQGRFTWGIRPEKRFVKPLLLLLLAVLFSIHCDFAQPRPDQIAAFAWETIARYFLSCMILVLFLRPRKPPEAIDGDLPTPERTGVPLPASLALFHLGSVMASGQVLLLDDQYVVFRLIELGGVVFVVLYASCAVRSPCASQVSASDELRRCRSLRTSCLTLLFVALNVGWVGGSLLYSHAESLNLVPNWLWRTNVSVDTSVTGVSRVGFSTSGRLSSVQRIMEDANPDPVLRITGDASPGYLRAMAFLTYRQSEWIDTSARDPVPPQENRWISRTNLFRLNNREPSREMTVRHESTVIDALFTPLGVCTIEAPLNTLERDDDDGTLRTRESRANLSYDVAYTTSMSVYPPSGDTIRRMLNLPPQLDPRIRQLANRIFRNCTTTAEKVEAVTRHFHTNYAYSLGLGVPFDQDPLTYFLIEASSGYCEYFASGSAILLRLAGVPTRYVTGFLVTDRDPDGKTWVARNMDAHAWVEAWDQETDSWTIVESTSQDYREESSLADRWTANNSGRHALFVRFLQAVYDYGLIGVLGWFFEVYSLQTAVVVSLAFFGAAVSLALLRRRAKSGRPAGRHAGKTPELAALHKMLSAVDRKLKSAGARRESHETLHAFADRIRQSAPAAESASPWPGSAADWYLAYAGLRYRGSIRPERVAELRERAEKLRRDSH
jgi:transglutaminase-like putative cysteine protease